MRSLCFLDGRLLPLTEARIDPQDRGFLFGDALYEVVKISQGTTLHLEPHLERLAGGLERIEIEPPSDLAAACRHLLTECGLEEGYLYLQVTRGAAPRTHLPPQDTSPTVLILPYPFAFPAPASQRLRALSVADWRWHFRDLKTTSLLATVMGKLEARRGSLHEVLFRGESGDLREGGSTNLFVVRDDRLETHPADGKILEGVTRRLVLELASEAGIEVESRPPDWAAIDRWQEAFLCGTLTGVQPLVELDGMTIGDGGAGPITARLAEALDRLEIARLDTR